MKLNIAIALGLVAGLLLGLAAAITESPLLMGVATAVEPLGDAFMNLLKMVVIPLVASVIFVGVARMGDLGKLSRLGAGTLIFFAVTTVISVMLGMGVTKALLPFASEALPAAVGAGTTEAPSLPGPIDFLLSLIPSNPFAAAAEGALLPLIVFTVLVGAATSALPAEQKQQLFSLAEALAAALIKLVHWILLIAPVGVFALAAPVASTTSSPATVPAMLEAADEEFHASPAVAGLVISLGAGLGRAGAALFQGSGLVFLAWLYGVPIPAAGVGAALLAVFIVSFTVPSIPGGSVLGLAPALGTVGVPLDGLAVLLGVDRIPDMARTATNVTGTLTATVVMDRLEGGDSAPR
jgi:Na+/H+-dicarboxylate symporter